MLILNHDTLNGVTPFVDDFMEVFPEGLELECWMPHHQDLFLAIPRLRYVWSDLLEYNVIPWWDVACWHDRDDSRRHRGQHFLPLNGKNDWRFDHALQLSEVSLVNWDTRNSLFVEAEFLKCIIDHWYCNGADLKASLITSCRAHYARFEGTSFSADHFQDCNLRDSFWKGANVEGSLFESCDFTDAHLASAVFKECEFVLCRFDDATMESSEFINCKFKECTWSRTDTHNTKGLPFWCKARAVLSTSARWITDQCGFVMSAARDDREAFFDTNNDGNHATHNQKDSK